MGNSGPRSDGTVEETLGVFAAQAQPATPLSASEVADELGCDREAARRSLETLADRGDLHGRDVAEVDRVWWRSPEAEGPPADGHRAIHEQFGDFVRAVEDYAIFTLDPAGRVTSWNEGAVRIKGYEEAEILGEHFSTFYTAADRERDRPVENLQAAAEDGRVEVEGWRVRADGSEFWADVVITAIRDDDGALEGFTKVTRDLTERKRAEDDLERERAFLDRTLEAAPVGIAAFSAEGDLERSNARAADIMGVTKGEIAEHVPGKPTVYDADGEPVPPEERPLARVLATGEPVHDWSCRIERPDGERRWVSVNAAPLLDEDGAVEEVIVTGEDVTDLRVEREFTERILEAVPMSVAVVDRDGTFERLNERARDNLGLDTSEGYVVGDRPVYDADGEPLPPEERPYMRVFETGEPVLDWEGQIDLPRGRTWLSVTTVPLGEAEPPERVVAAASDITKLKEQERRLERRQEELEAELEGVFERVDDAFYALDEEFRFTYVNERAGELLDRAEAELLGESVWEAFPEAAETVAWERLHRALETQEPTGYEIYYEPLGIWVEAHVYPSETGLSVYFRDVTERVEREQELERYEAIVESVNDGVYTVDASGTITRVNASYAEMMGRPREELVGTDVADLVDDDVVERARALEHELVAGERETATLTAELPRPDGGSVVAEATFSILSEDDDGYERIAVVRDVTERKRRERALEESERLYRTLVQNVPSGGIGLVDHDLRYQIAGGESFEVAGLMAEEVEGRRVDELFDEELASVLTTAYEAALAGETRTFEVEVGGRELEMRTLPVRDEAGEVFGALGMSQDVTDRKQFEETLTALYDSARDLLGAESAAAVSEVVVETAAEVLDLSGVVTYLYDDDADHLYPAVQSMADGFVTGGLPTLPLDESSITGRAWLSGEPVRFEDAADSLYVGTDDTEMRAGIFVPMGDHGVLCAGTRTAATFDEATSRLVELLAANAETAFDRVERERALERYKTVFDTVDDGIYILGPEFRFREVNDAYVEMTGFDREELLGSHCSLVVDEDVSGEAEALVRDLAEGADEAATLEADVVREDGERVPGESRFTPLPSDDGFGGSVGVVRDLSDRRAYERELRRFETLIEESTDVNGILTGAGVFSYVTPSVEYVLGYTAEELVGEYAFEYIHPDDREQMLSEFADLVDGDGARRTVEFRFEHADGSWVWLEARGKNLRDDPMIDGLVVYTRDVTDRKAYEAELEARAGQQEVVSELGRRALENPPLDELFAEAAERVAETLDTDYCKVLDLDTDAEELLLRQGVGWRDGVVGDATVAADENSQAGYTLASAEPVVVDDLDAETRFSGPELLTSHDVEGGISAVIGSAEEPWGILGTHDTDRRSFTVEDVDFVRSVANILTVAIERQGYEDELQGLVEELEESNERLEQFAYIASHDLQEPLRMISNYLQLVEDRYAEALDSDGREFIEFAVDGAERMRAMIDGLLAYSRVDTRAAPLEPTDSEAVVEDVLANLRVQIDENDATVDVGDLPTVAADRNQLEQVFQNLVSNAIKYRGEAPPEIAIDAERAGGSWRFRVADNGIGMAPERTDRIFEVFRRLHGADEYDGTGIGLALCKKIVERHGGDIRVESEPGEGSTFSFTIPATDDDRVPADGPVEASPEVTDD